MTLADGDENEELRPARPRRRAREGAERPGSRTRATPDTGFLPERLAGFDAVAAMFHDQGLPVLKHASFGHAVNVTLGLPIVRTSVDHGTALDLAGTRKADTGSLRAAFELALDLSGRVRTQTSHW